MILTMKYIRKKGIFVREMSGNFQENPSSDLADTLIFTYFQYNVCCLQATNVLFLFPRIATLYAFLIKCWCETRTLVKFKAKAKSVVFQKIQNPFPSHCSNTPLSFQATLAATPIPVGKMLVQIASAGIPS